MNLFNMPLTQLKGIGEKTARIFEEKGISCVYDLIRHFPLKYEDRGVISYVENAVVGESICLNLEIASAARVFRIRKNLTITKATGYDETGAINLCWYNIKYMDKAIKRGGKYRFYGQIQKSKGGMEMVNPVVEKENEEGRYTGKIIPVYGRIYGISQKVFMKAVEEGLKKAEKMIFSTIPESVEKKYKLMNVYEAYKNIHFPQNEEMLCKARERFAFESFFLFQTAMGVLRKKEKDTGIVFTRVETDNFEKRLPFVLTKHQKAVLEDIKKDLISGKCSKRLIQGDVGAGKTIIAVALCYMAKNNGYQSCVMAPTEILAKQHFINFCSFLKEFKVECLTSSTSKKEKEAILTRLSSGEIDVLIGTHALIEDNVVFKSLGYVICDEQHRFGVNQRMKLIEKGENPHLAVMTATPIPRSLALILYGDLVPGVIKGLPPGRKDIKTNLVPESMRERVYAFAEKELKNGGQAYIVCPLVEESDKLSLKSAIELKKEIEEKFSGFNVGLLHGKMKEKEKNDIMEAFKNNKIQILVSTTVVEVGVDVRNANIMIIENAERFGLSQLHQLRGRVGRGERQSYCIMFAKTSNVQTLERLKVIESSNDGFYISEQDLKIRGPGDFFGTRQSGLPEIKGFAGEGDIEIMKMAAEAVNGLKNKTLKISNNEREIINFIVKMEYLSSNVKNILN